MANNFDTAAAFDFALFENDKAIQPRLPDHHKSSNARFFPHRQRHRIDAAQDNNTAQIEHRRLIQPSSIRHYSV
ncbi:hypothetical protein SH528x_003131 [Novipirellula sp. SH528]|uniref:hypothetical protein n=1 Tax=Novipirellula sp. SH528 TaxID=3454466 RepID=UPI003FA0CBFC